MKLTNQLKLYLFIALLISCSILALSTKFYLEQRTSTLLHQQNTSAAQQLVKQFNSDANHFVARLSQLVQQAEFIQQLDRYNADPQRLTNSFIFYLKKIKAVYPEITALQLVNQHGESELQLGEHDTFSSLAQLDNKETLHQLINSNVKSKLEFQTHSDSIPRLKISTLALTSDATPYLLVTHIPLLSLQQYVNDYAQTGFTQLLIVDNQYNILFSPIANTLWSHIDGKQALSPLMAQPHQTQLEIENHHYLVQKLTSLTLANSNFNILGLMPEKQYNALVTSRIISPIAMVTALLFSLCGALYVLVNKYIISRILAVNAIAAKILNEHTLSSTQPTENNELDQLTNRLTNIVELQQHYNKDIQQAACFDSLTQLSNRYLFSQVLEQEIDRSIRHNRHFALIYLDVDGFKRINENYGHPFGDKVLIKFAELLQNQVRDSDTVGRWNEENNIARLAGDEFAILLTELKKNYPAIAVAKRLLETLEKPLVIDGQQIFIQASIGIAHYPADANSAEILIKNADAAMNQAKSSGRNQFKIFSKELNLIMERQEALYQALVYALKNDEFDLHFQPYIYASDSSIAGAEALLRWSSQSLGNIGPAEFIPIAEQYGLITEIDRWVLRRALKTIQQHHLGSLGIKISINISNLHFNNRYFPEYLVTCMDEFNVSPEQFELEITETAMTELDDQFLEVANAISAIGVCLVLDDFGTGFTSLSHLSHLPVSKIKIDRSHVVEISNQTEGIRLVDVLLSISESYQLQITAEGVEEQCQQDYLKSNRCDFLQGYLFYRPQSEKEFITLLNNKGISI